MNHSILKKMSLINIASKLEDDEIKDLRQVFSAFDIDKDGQISLDELKKGLFKFHSAHLCEQDINEIFKSIDVNKNFRIDYTEFIAATISDKILLKQKKLYDTFNYLDKDNDGKITKKEIMEVLKAEKTKEKEIEKYIKDVDKNGDNAIDYREFLELMGYQNEIIGN